MIIDATDNALVQTDGAIFVRVTSLNREVININIQPVVYSPSRCDEAIQYRPIMLQCANICRHDHRCWAVSRPNATDDRWLRAVYTWRRFYSLISLRSTSNHRFLAFVKGELFVSLIMVAYME